MTLLRPRSRGIDRRLAVVDAYQFPASVRQRFSAHHETLSGEDVRTVEAGTRQWFRLAARHPKAKLSMPSVVVDDMWHELVLHTRDYAQLCDAAFVGFLHHTPESAMSSEGAAVNRGAALAKTFRLAQQDEGCEPGRLPLLFRVDQQLKISGGRRYLADCGGRGQCHDMPGTVCLQHVKGPGRPTLGDWDRNRLTRGEADSVGGGSCGGCGGGP